MAANSRTKGHNFKIFKKHALHFTRRNAFSQRVINDWNSLPQHDMVNAASINSFKNKLDDWWSEEQLIIS